MTLTQSSAILPRVSRQRRRSHRNAGERGVVLVITLLLLTLLAALSLAMVFSVSSDSMINGYYRNYRGAFYAADSGANVSRQYMLNQVAALIPTDFAVTTAPLDPVQVAKVPASVITQYGNMTPINTDGAKGSWNGSFKISNTAGEKPTLTLIAATAHPGKCPTTISYTSCTVNSKGDVIGYQYIYNYFLTAVGQARGSEQTKIQDFGKLIFNMSVTPAAGTVTNFAAWGMFIDKYAVCSGSSLVQGTISGPVFTNGGWTFSTGTTGYIFTDPVGSASTTAGYLFTSNNECDAKAAPKYTCTTSGSSGCKNQTIAPTFQGGFNLGQSKVPLPTNDFSQAWAAVDGVGSGEPDYNFTNKNADLHSSMLKTVTGASYPSGGATSGVFVPYQSVSGTNTVSGGGIYVEGNANVTMSIGTTTIGGTSVPTQIFSIAQGSTTTTVTITVPPAGSASNLYTTRVSNGTTTINLAGVPANCSGAPPPGGSPCTSSTAGSSPGTMLYVDGTISSLGGTHNGSGASLPAVQDGAAVTITAKNDIVVTSDILYKSEPVTLTTADALIPANDHGQVLGLFTATGNVKLQNSQSSGNLEIDASIATISQTGSGGIVNTGSAIGTLTIVGGRIQNTIQNINSSKRNVFFDRRFSSGGFAPPWFPSTTVSPAGLATSTTTISPPQRTKWVVVYAD